MRRSFNDVIDRAFRDGTPVIDAIMDETMGRVRPIRMRCARLQMLGPCKVCGEAKWVCEHDDEGQAA